MLNIEDFFATLSGPGKDFYKARPQPDCTNSYFLMVNQRSTQWLILIRVIRTCFPKGISSAPGIFLHACRKEFTYCRESPVGLRNKQLNSQLVEEPVTVTWDSGVNAQSSKLVIATLEVVTSATPPDSASW